MTRAALVGPGRVLSTSDIDGEEGRIDCEEEVAESASGRRTVGSSQA